MTKPFIVALEGIPGSGKTTLKDTLIVPGATIERVEQILPNDPQSHIGLTLESIITSDYLKTERATQTKADIVIFDRYYLSTLAYQSAYDRLNNADTLAALSTEYNSARINGRLIEPDLTIYINTPLEQSFLRKQRVSGDRLWINERFLEYTCEYYRAIPKLYTIDGRGTLENIKHEIEEKIAHERR